MQTIAQGSRTLRSAVGRVGRLAALLIVGLQHTPARADPPPPDSVETCTIEKQQQPGEECLVCGAWHGDPAKCQKRLGSRGYARRCRGDGASVWSEVWCRAAGAKGQGTPTPGMPHGGPPKKTERTP